MKITNTIINNKSYSQIFVELKELEKNEVKSEIEKRKQNGDKVAIFVLGNEEILPIIKKNIIYTFGKA